MLISLSGLHFFEENFRDFSSFTSRLSVSTLFGDECAPTHPFSPLRDDPSPVAGVEYRPAPRVIPESSILKDTFGIFLLAFLYRRRILGVHPLSG